MSCHDIGHGLNSVVKKVLELYDGGEVSRAAAKEIIRACKKVVHWCDGNEYEAVECMRGRRCGKCLKPVDAQGLFDILEVSYELQEAFWKAGDAKLDTVADEFCPECFDEVALAITGDEQSGPSARAKLSAGD